MKFKELKPIIEAERLTIFETFPGYNVLRKENWLMMDADEPSEWDDYEVWMISGKADCEMRVYLEKKE